MSRPRGCSYLNCNNLDQQIDVKCKNIKFYSFPSNLEMCKQWVESCHNPALLNLKSSTLQSRRYICSEHFHYFHFINPLVKNKRLKRNAVPLNKPLSKNQNPFKIKSVLKNGEYVFDHDEQYLIFKKTCYEKLKTNMKAKKVFIVEDDVTTKTNSPTLPLVSHINIKTVSQTESSLSKCKDLVSPQRLMNITENMCPLMRPISPPTYSDSDDSNVPLMPEVTMATYLSDRETEEGKEHESKVDLVQPSSPSPHFLFNLCNSSTAGTTTLTTTTTTTSTASATTFVTLKAIVPKGMLSSTCNIKRPLVSSSPSRVEPINETGARKYKKILPKNEEKNSNTNSPVPSIEMSSIVESPEEVVLNLSGLSINKLEKTCKGSPTANTTSLFLDNNLLQTLPAIDSYSRLTKLSLVNNQIDSLIWFGRLSSLQVLNLSKNKINNIDGLWKLWQLTHVNLSENLIQVLRGQTNDSNNNKLEHLDVSGNKINLFEDLSMLANLKVLFLHKNQIKSLSQARKHLPPSLSKLSLAENSILNLGDINELCDFGLLKELTLKHNTCTNVLQLVDKQGNWIGPPRPFDYRPFVLTCCPRLSYLDDEQITEAEKIKADWLISDGKLKNIHTQKHALLVTYLSEVCPVPVKHQDESQNREQIVRTEIQNQEHLTTNISVLNTMSVSNTKSNSLKNSSPYKVPKIRTKKTQNERKRRRVVTKEKDADCSNEFPCKHYVELIEEKAKNYKLQRANESLMDTNEALQHRIQVLETALAENGFNVDEIFVKFEVDDEEEIDSVT